MLEAILENEALVSIGLTGLTAGITYLFKLLRDFMKAHIENKQLQGVLVRLSHAVEQEVAIVANNQVKKAKRDGNWDQAAKNAAKSAARAGVEKALGDKALKEINKVLGDTPNAVISKAIDAAAPRVNAEIGRAAAIAAAAMSGKF